MKNFRKLTLLLLSLVMAFSCLAVFALAEDGGEEKQIAAIEALMEYYNDEGIYVCDAFDNANAGSALVLEDTVGAYATVGGKTVWLATLDGSNALFSPEIAIPDTSENAAIVYSFCVSAGATDKGYLALELSGASQSVDGYDAQSVLVFDYNEGKAYFASMDADAVLSSMAIEGFVPENDAWYTLSMIYSRKANTFVGQIAKEGGETVTFEYYLDGIVGLSVLQLRSRNLGNEGVSVAWDLLEIYEGTFFRSNLAGERQKYLDEKLLAYMVAYDDFSDAVKGAVVKTVDALLGQGYAPAIGSETEAYYNATFEAEIVNYYWNSFVAKVDAFDSSLKYDERYAALVDAKDPKAADPAKPSGISDSFYNAMIAKYDAEADALSVIAEHSKNLIAMVPGLGTASNYAELLESLLAFEAEREFLLDPVSDSYDETYFGLAYAIDIYKEALAKFVSAKQNALTFIAAVDAMQQGLPGQNFGNMWDAYSAARQIMASADFAFIRDAYFASLTFSDDGAYVEYDGRIYAIDSVDKKSATVTINYMPYTITLSDYTLILEGEGMKIVFEPVDGSGTEFADSWRAKQTVASACVKFDERAGYIEAGAEACKNLISEINIALVANGYDVCVAKRDEVLAKFGAIRADYEEGGKYFGYAGVAEALASFDAFGAKLDAYKVAADAYIALIQDLKVADGYAAVRALIDDLTPMYDLANVKGLEGYANAISSIQDANKIYDANKKIVVEAEGNALAFIEKVNAAVAVDDLASRLVALRAAQKLYDKLVDGATGVAEAKETFAAEKASYLADAAAMNESSKEQGEKLVDIALANINFVAPQKLVFIIKKVYEL